MIRIFETVFLYQQSWLTINLSSICDLHVNTERNEIANKNLISKCCEFTILFMNVYHLDKKNWNLQ